jgi:hypothetical protein
MLAQEIAISRRLKPGLLSGRLYFSPNYYSVGHQAVALLSIPPGKAAEVACSVPDSSIQGLREERPADPILDDQGNELRPGGGPERWTEQDVEFNGEEKWFALEIP